MAFAPPPQPLAPTQRFAGGQLPPVGTVLSETLSAFTRDMGPYALAGLGQLVVVLPVVFGLFITLYAAIVVVAFGGMAGAAVVAESGSEEGAAAMSLLLVGVLVLLVLGMIGLVNALLAPVFGSLYRAIAQFQRGEGELGFGSAFSSLGTQLVPGIVVMILVMVLVSIGAVLCYLPALLVGFFIPWAFPLVALHGVGPFAALKRSAGCARRHFSWHLGFFGYSLLVNIVGNYIPLVGPMFALAFHVRVYREVFGDGAVPSAP